MGDRRGARFRVEHDVPASPVPPRQWAATIRPAGRTLFRKRERWTVLLARPGYRDEEAWTVRGSLRDAEDFACDRLDEKRRQGPGPVVSRITLINPERGLSD